MGASCNCTRCPPLVRRFSGAVLFLKNGLFRTFQSLCVIHGQLDWASSRSRRDFEIQRAGVDKDMEIPLKVN